MPASELVDLDVGADEVASLSASLRVSPRQLRRRCRHVVGLAPKAVQRMLRFQRFLALADQAGGDLVRLAGEAGYADQAHLTRESRRLSGRTPAALLREADEHCRGAHDHVASYAPLLGPLAFAPG